MIRFNVLKGRWLNGKLKNKISVIHTFAFKCWSVFILNYQVQRFTNIGKTSYTTFVPNWFDPSIFKLFLYFTLILKQTIWSIHKVWNLKFGFNLDNYCIKCLDQESLFDVYFLVFNESDSVHVKWQFVNSGLCIQSIWAYIYM